MDIALVFVIILLLLAVFDLTVGVANDAVNFLNSAIGSKVASFKVIMLIAALGVFVGVTFSSGLMEIARKGIFNPEMFVLMELLAIFLAVMFQDILLLDMFNTFGFPTSTTVSIIFGLLGSSLAISIIKVSQTSGDFLVLMDYINVGNVFKIVSAIFLSIVFAFVFGSLIQYITRLIFTFDYEKRFRRYGSIWGGVALTSLSLFILLKGAKGSSFMTEDVSTYIQSNIWLLSFYAFLAWTVLLQLMMWFTKINPLKVIVLIGTFSLALAFAANDLVNFIGAPLAGLAAYNFAPDMSLLSKPVQANTWLLLIAGAVMVATLYLSKKARSVTQTTISLGRQDEGIDRFESNLVARFLVRIVLNIFDMIKKITPDRMKKFVESRFNNEYFTEKNKTNDAPAFDLLRAAVNLMVAAGLISLATSLKLPLSTTYVTFIVAMAAALPDRAWGRESAVYRVAGVISVIGGWFVTAITAAVVAGIIATLIFYFELYAVIALGGLIVFNFWRSNRIHTNREKDFNEQELSLNAVLGSSEQTISHLKDKINYYYVAVKNSYNHVFEGIKHKNLDKLRKAKKESQKTLKQSNLLIADFIKALDALTEEELDSQTAYGQVIGGIHQMSISLANISKEVFDYIDNNHRELEPDQIKEFDEMKKSFNEIIDLSIRYMKDENNGNLDKLRKAHDVLINNCKKFSKNQVKRIKKLKKNKKRALLFLNVLTQTRSLADSSYLVIESSNEFFKLFKIEKVKI
jgi:phosphate/sulfate permease